MRAVGTRELRENISRILHEVSDRREEIEITHHGRVLAHLVPPPEVTSREEMEQTIAELRGLSEQVGRLAGKVISASDLLDEERRS